MSESRGDIVTKAGGIGDGGSASAGNLHYPTSVAFDGNGNLYISDRDHNKIRKIDAATGIITTVAGNGSYGYSGDNGKATEATLNAPTGIAVDSSGNIYIADESNHRVRKVTASTGVITTVAGIGTAGFAGDGVPAAGTPINRPRGVALDASGNLYI